VEKMDKMGPEPHPFLLQEAQENMGVMEDREQLESLALGVGWMV